eukprot:3429349-Amphidinium_carterae.3
MSSQPTSQDPGAVAHGSFSDQSTSCVLCFLPPFGVILSTSLAIAAWKAYCSMRLPYWPGVLIRILVVIHAASAVSLLEERSRAEPFSIPSLLVHQQVYSRNVRFELARCVSPIYQDGDIVRRGKVGLAANMSNSMASGDGTIPEWRLAMFDDK